VKQSLKLVALAVSFVFSSLTTQQALAQCPMPLVSQPTLPSTDEIFMDDALPAGASVTTGTQNWDTSQYAAGTQSFYLSGAGQNVLRIDDIDQYLKIGSGKVVLYVLIDSCSTTREIKLTYSSAYRTAHVYWGENLMPSGTDPLFRRGNLPAAGTWARLEVPISSPLGLQGHELEWLQIETYDGKVWFDNFGQNGVGCVPPVISAPSIPSGDTVWVDDSIPSGSYISYGEWDSSQKAEGTQSLVYPYFGQSVISPVRVNDLNQVTASGDDLIVYVMPTSCATVKELMITWWAGSASGTVYWGQTGIGGESTAVFMGSTVPAADTWHRIAIPAATLGLDGATITAVRVQNWGGQVWVDHIGNAP
jgi:hypothetical protein